MSFKDRLNNLNNINDFQQSNQQQENINYNNYSNQNYPEDNYSDQYNNPYRQHPQSPNLEPYAVNTNEQYYQGQQNNYNQGHNYAQPQDQFGNFNSQQGFNHNQDLMHGHNNSYYESRKILNRVDTADALRVPSANKKKRFLASLLDGLVLSIPTGILSMLFIVPTIQQVMKSPSYEIGGYKVLINQILGKSILISLISLFLFFLYYVVVPCYVLEGQTLGKKIMKIKIINCESYSQPLSLGQYLLREFLGRFLSSLLFIGYLMILFTKEGRGLHDIIAKTNVINYE
ncbi:RDD family protein [Alkaliphilus sp. B6464]|uniref:RDD family protein n=1 Tax=Alkaliphilus sp. B6464 TaxID=2731219 RepID=UPI001BA656BA|nr:RDD family protein [Alkaliphilus sp. B6464]QUH21954.1 RDD family protein [Alkaliphilus sp. B6464]